jgi:N-acetylneuraminic acid mutarotase
MRYHALLPGALALSTLWLAACGNDTPTEPTAGAKPAPNVPEMALAGSWIVRANMPAGRTEVAAATVTDGAGRSIVYAIGGYNSSQLTLNKVTAYSVATNTWTFRRPLPTTLAYSNGAGVINGKIYVSGGYLRYLYGSGVKPLTTNALYMYDPAMNIWTRKRDMPMGSADGSQKPGIGGVTGVINGKLYVVTSCVTTHAVYGDLEGCLQAPAALFLRYNPVTDRWATLPSPFPGGASAPYAGGVIGGKFYVMQGWQEDAQLSVYDPATNQWTPKNALGLGRPGAATAVLGGKLYVIGGQRYNPSLGLEILDKTIAYDPATDRWTPVATLPIPRTGLAATTVLLNGKQRIELVGGTVPKNNLQYVP